MSLLLALLLASNPPADAPVKPPIEDAVKVKTAVLELYDHSFIARGSGCYLPDLKCIDVGHELQAGRARRALFEESPTFTGYIIAASVGLVIGLVGGGYLMLRICGSVPGICR